MKHFLIVFALLITTLSLAQQGTTSPYSFFGIGNLKFKGTVENRSMGGIGVYLDSIHVNLRNPAAYAGNNLESAYFDPVHIRKTSKHHDLHTDASFRFERGVDPEMTLFALKRASLMIKELAGGKISSDVKDVYPNPFEKIELEVTWKNIDRLIGKVIGKEVSPA